MHAKKASRQLLAFIALYNYKFATLNSGLPIKLQNGAVLPGEGQPVALVVGGHGAADHAVGVGDVLFSKSSALHNV